MNIYPSVDLGNVCLVDIEQNDESRWTYCVFLLYPADVFKKAQKIDNSFFFQFLVLVTAKAKVGQSSDA